MVGVKLVLGEDGTVFAADDDTDDSDGILEAGVVGFSVETVLASDGLAWTDLTVNVVVAEVGEDVEVGFGEAVGGVEVTTAGVDVVDGREEACGKSFTAVFLDVTDFTVVTGEVMLTFSDMTLLAVAVAGIDVGTALTAIMEEGKVNGVLAAGGATVVVLAEPGSVVFTVVEETDCLGSTEALEVVVCAILGSTKTCEFVMGEGMGSLQALEVVETEGLGST